MHNQFFIGIVENRKDDPLKLGRCQVRVFGVHSENKKDVPTADLPWAIPIFPVTGTSLSGMGNSPAFLVEGSTVVVFFQDGESKQCPVILGSMHGVPMSVSPFGERNTIVEEIFTNTEGTTTITTGSGGTLIDSSGMPVTSQGMVDSNSSEREKLKAALGAKESSNNYKAVNRLNYLGKYQMGAAMLTDLGYVKKGTSNRDLDNPDNWTGKDGIKSKEDFLNSKDVQEKAMDAELDLNTKRLKNMGVIDSSSRPEEVAGYLATSHLLGTGGARDMKNGITKTDANGVTGKAYYDLGYKAVSGVSPVVSPEAATKDNPYNVPAASSEQNAERISSVGIEQRVVGADLGFSDPDKIYPRKDYLKEQDSNRLARNQNIGKTIVPYKEETRDRNVVIANRKGTWDQSPVPYNARYPFNHVLETESGHIFENDDTPKNERIHEWHRTGTFTEIDRNGTEVRKIVGDKYEIWERNGFVHVKGTVNITVEGDARVLVANDLDIEVDGDVHWTVGGNVDWAIGGSLKFKTGGVEHHTNGGDFAVDAPNIFLNSGRSTAGRVPGPYRSRQGLPKFSDLTLEPRNFEELAEFETDDLSPEETANRQKILEEAGLIDSNQEEGVKDGNPQMIEKNDVKPKEVVCGMFVSGEISNSMQISPNFKMGALTLGRQIKAQSGLKDTEIACNLKAVAENICEPIKAKYPNMIITSGFREPSSNAKSQHPLGQAVDIQFSGVSSSEYLSIAKDLATFLPYDQLILEHRSNRRNAKGEPTTWLHISHTRGGNRKEVFTMDNDARISEFGQLISVK